MNSQARFRRKILREVLGILTKITISKHKPLIFVVLGEINSSYVREYTYFIVKSQINARRNLERTSSEFSIPLTVLGIMKYPKNTIGWIKVLVKSFIQIFFIRPYKHALIVQVRHKERYITEFWIKRLSPDYIIVNYLEQKTFDNFMSLSKHPPMIISKDELSKIIKSEPNGYANKIADIIKIPSEKLNEVILSSVPKTRVRIISGKSNSLIIDARHYYYPPNLNSILEIADNFQGKKLLISSLSTDETDIPANYFFIKSPDRLTPKDSHIYVFRGFYDEYTPIIKKLALNEFEI